MSENRILSKVRACFSTTLPQEKYFQRFPKSDLHNLNVVINSFFEPPARPVGAAAFAIGSSVRKYDFRDWGDVDIKIYANRGISVSKVKNFIDIAVSCLTDFTVEKGRVISFDTDYKDCLYLYPTHGTKIIHIILPSVLEECSEDYISINSLVRRKYSLLGFF